MANSGNRAKLFVLAFIFMTLSQTALAQSFGQRVLRSLEVSQVADDYVARIEFNFGMQYLNHIPSDFGREIKISLNQPTRGREDEGLLGGDEHLTAGGQTSVLDTVYLDTSNPDKPLLVAQFSESVSFSIKPGNGFRSITITFRPERPAITAARPETAEPAPVTPAPTVDTSTESGRLYSAAREAFVAGDYNRAIQHATSAIASGSEDETRDALELLGMARETKGQLAHATAEYKRYIELYEGRYDITRVKQRLDALLTAALPAAPTVVDGIRVAADDERDEAWSTRRFGGFSQYYYNDSLKLDGGDSKTTRSSLVTDFNVTTRSSRDAHLVEGQLTGSYDYDLMDEDPENVSRINEAYASWSNLESDLSVLVGRESRSTDGVQGRYDGIAVSKQLSERIKLNLIAGYPVSSTRDSVETERQFQSISLDLGNFNNRWDFNVFYTERDFAGLTDRQAIGGEARYFNNGFSLFGLVDYDLSFSELNTAMLLGNWFQEKSTVFFSLDHRKSPSLSLGNALLGQADTSMEDLRGSMSYREIQQLALAHTAESTFGTVGYTRTLNDRHQVSVDVTASKLSETTGSEYLPASEATATELFYNFQWISNSLIRQRDSYVFGYKYEDLDRHTRHTLSVNARMPVGKRWKINPKLALSKRESHDGLETQDKLKFSLNALLKINRDTEFEVEFGTERIEDNEPLFSGDTDINYVFIGFRKYF